MTNRRIALEDDEHKKWRLIQCFRGSAAKYDDLDSRDMTDREREVAQILQNDLDSSKVWVR